MDATTNTHGPEMESDGALTLREYAAIVREALNQPPWRANADKEADYADGNQLSSDLLQRQRQLGIPPAKENIIGPTIAAVCGYEAKSRTDWRVTPDGDPEGQDVADALNYRLNQAERHSRADRALSQAFRAMVTTGIGWVEVARPPSSLDYPYRCRYVHRNELWWDMRATELDLSDARWLRRRRWVHKGQAARMFPEHADVLLRTVGSWIADEAAEMLEGGVSTKLHAAAEAERAWTQQEDAWHNAENNTVAIDEVWYRRWVPVLMLKLASGRVVQYDESNAVHQAAVMSGNATLRKEVVTKVRRAYWVGPHCLHDGESPYPHRHFPYVAVLGYREDMTGIPYGLVRDMLFPQDNLNSAIAKLRWGMSAVRTERTKGAVAMADHQFRRQIARVDADIVLDPQHMAQQGARFEVKRDFQLNDQQFQLMQDSRAAMQRVSGVTASFMGQEGTATSGLQEQTQLEQSQVAVADLMDNFAEARQQVGELLMALIIEDMGREPATVIVEGDVLNPPRTVQLNVAETDPATGVQYLSNDVGRTRLMVALEDVPTSSGFRAQQLAVMSETAKAAPPELLQVMLPYMIHMMDLPKKEQIVQAIMQAQQQPDPEAMREQIKQELMHDIKERELELREREIAARERLMQAQTVQTGVQASYSAMQAGAQVAQMPMIAPIADVVMQGAGYQRPEPAGQDPNFPTPEQAAARNIRSPYVEGEGAQVGSEQLPEMQVRQNTSPAFPPVPQQVPTGMQGIETPATGDNLPA